MSDTTTPVESAPTAVQEPSTPSLEVRNLHRYFGKLKAVHNISFKTYPGQVMGFIGPNGAGKTTTMRIIATLDIPTAGDVFIGGYSVVDDPDKVRRILGFMPDSFGKYANMNVVEYLDFFARAHGFRGKKRTDAIERVMDFTELDKLAEKPIAGLSKGMSQRLGLGRTLVHDPEVLVLDEPAAGLDPRARVELRELIRLMATKLNKTVLISSHILTELSEICDSAAIVEAGRILASGTIEEISEAQRQRRGHTTAPLLSCRVQKDQAGLQLWLAEQPFVRAVTISGTSINFEFAADEDAQFDLLKRMLAADFRVLEYHKQTESLEDAFMAITEGITQ